MEQFSVHRCYKPKDFGTIAMVQIHHFSDASKVGYGALFYLGFVDADSKVHRPLVMSKSHLAPLKSLSVPRLQLTAATLAVKLGGMLRKELEILISHSVFWTDSTALLRYIKNEFKLFHTFISNRLTIIQDGCTPGNGDMQIASEILPMLLLEGCLRRLCQKTKWISGADFLWQDESSLLAPPARRENISYDVLEFKREMLVHAVELQKSMETAEKLLCYVFLFLGQAQKASGVHIAFQGMVAEQTVLQVRPNQGSVLANEGQSYCR